MIGDCAECPVERFLAHQRGFAKRKRMVHALPVAVDEDQRPVASKPGPFRGAHS